MAGSEVVTNCDLDVTIFLVEKWSMEEPAGSTSNKRRRTSVDPSQVAHGKQVGQVKVKASRLRKCSTYFDTCMSERWAQSKVTNKEMEFHLEVHTKVRYYEDCFSRMNYLYKPIGSVVCCIELLKVASQIDFQALVDIAVKCLGGTTWSEEDEKMVREFCTSAHLIPFDSLTDLLSARFHHLPWTQEEQLEKLSLINAKDLFSRFLWNALKEVSLLDLVALNTRNKSRTKFAQAFNVVVSGVESGDVHDEILEHIQGLQTTALANRWTRVQKEYNIFAMAFSIEGALSDMCWLFEVAREVNAAQALVVELLRDDLNIAERLFRDYYSDPPLLKVSHLRKWASIIYALFQDILNGKLFLNSFQRSTLFYRWRWLVCTTFLDIHCKHGKAHEHVEAFLVKFLTTLPQTVQEKFWMQTDIEPEQGIYWDAHMMWISQMVTRKVQSLQPQ